MSKSAKGRPAGQTNQTYQHAEEVLSRCGKCGSTDRAPYYNRREQVLKGTAPDGQPFTHVLWRRTKCLACGQHRIDRTYENRGGKK